MAVWLGFTRFWDII